MRQPSSTASSVSLFFSLSVLWLGQLSFGSGGGVGAVTLHPPQKIRLPFEVHQEKKRKEKKERKKKKKCKVIGCNPRIIKRDKKRAGRFEWNIRNQNKQKHDFAAVVL